MGGVVRHGRRIRLGFLLAIAGLLAVAQPAGALWRPRDLAGVALHPWRLETRPYAPFWPLRDPALREKTFSRLQRAGIRYARVDLKWSSVEAYSPMVRDWSEFDATVTSARRHHVQLEPIVAFTPAWANGGAGPWTYPTHPDQFAPFFAAALRRYPDIHSWEIWNEPNSRDFSPPRPDAAKFVAMLRAADSARRQVGSRARIVAGGLAPGRSVGVFAEQIARLGAFRYADALGVHPYSRKQPEKVGSALLKLPKLESLVSRAAGRQLDLWISEYGYPNARVRSSFGPPGTEHDQAVRLRKAFAIAVGWPWLKRLTWYGFRDDCPFADKVDCRFGLVREDFSPKLAMYAFLAVLAGNLPKLETATSMRHKSKRVRRGTRLRRVHKFYGRVRTPGTDPAVGSVLVTATRRYHHRKRTRRIVATLRNGSYKVSFRRLRPGRWRFRAKFLGDSRYSRSSSRPISLKVRRRR